MSSERPVINRATLQYAFENKMLETIINFRDTSEERNIPLVISEGKDLSIIARRLLNQPEPDTEGKDFFYLCRQLSGFGAAAGVRLKSPISKVGKTCSVDLYDESPATPEVLEQNL